MLHRCPLRHPRMVPLFACATAVFVCAAALALFYAAFAPNWDVPLYSAVMAAVALLPLVLMLRPMFGFRTLQVEHAGVVTADYLFGRCLRRRVFQAAEMRHFDWETDTADGFWTLRLLIQYHPAERPVFLSVLHTDNPYLMAAVWRDLELHYPGSGLREAPPAVAEPRPHPSRLLGALLLAAAAALLWGAWGTVSRPLCLCADGQVSPAVIQQLVWDSPRPGSTYHLLCRPNGSSAARMGITAYEQGPAIPQEGMRCEILWSPQSDYCCDPSAVAPFLLPFPLLAFVLMLAVCGAWGFLSRRTQRAGALHD